VSEGEPSPVCLVDRVAAPPAGGGPAAFRRLDAILVQGMAVARERFGSDAAADPFRGLHIGPEQATAALDGLAGTPLLGAARSISGRGEDHLPAWVEILRGHPGWAWLCATYRLSDEELDIVLIALGPEFDPRYERVYGYLQDDVTRRRPSVNLTLDLVARTVEDKLATRAAFGAGGPLLGERLLALAAPPGVIEPSLLAHIVVPDEQIVDVLLGQGGMTRGLARWCRLTAPGLSDWSSTPLPPSEQAALVAALRQAWTARRPLRLHFRSPRGTGRRCTAEALAAELGVPLLEVNLSALTDRSAVDEVLHRAFREAALHGALPYLHDVDALTADPHAREDLVRHLAAQPGVVILGGVSAWVPGGPPLGVLEVSFARPGFEVRLRAWERCLAEAGVDVPTGTTEALAGRFRFGPGNISDAVATAVATAGRRAVARQDPGGMTPSTAVPSLTPAELVAAGRTQTRHHLAALTRAIDPLFTWQDLVLPVDSTIQLRELCQRVVLAQRVWRDWGFEGKFSSGQGVTALFAGPPGTGKTMAAEVIAGELGLDLFTIDLSSVISKYIGETEKNLERIFAAAAEAYAVLLFDEADALFGKRSEVRDSHDRYANIETAYLLQRMEQYDGVAILTTNLREHLDAAFVRRLQFIVDFPFPDEDQRRRIWQRCFPADAPRADGIDFERLGRDVRLSGAGIKSAVLHAAFLAADEGVPIGMPQLLRAVRREHQKAGTVPPDTEPEG
jgi:AAA+ superfamily predicted ATPase